MIKISIIIPTYNRSELLFLTLESLKRQSITRLEFEVVIIDHGSTDQTRNIVDKFMFDLQIRYLFVERIIFSISVPKNLGWRSAVGEIICFLDSGMVVPRDFLESHIKFHIIQKMVGKTAVGLGLCYGQYREDSDWLPTDLELTQPLPDYWITDVSIQDPRYFIDMVTMEEKWVYCWGGNISVPRQLLQKSGGFAEELSGWGFEDLELGYRFSQLGVEFLVVEGGWSVHLPHPRDAMAERIKQATQNWHSSYLLHPVISMEAFGAASLDIEMHKIAKHDILSATSSHNICNNSDREFHFIQGQICQENLNVILIGARDEWRDRIDPTCNITMTIPDIKPCSKGNALIYSCLGLRLPLFDKCFDLCIITTIWQFLDFSPRPGLSPYLKFLLEDTARVANTVIFMYDESIPCDIQFLRNLVLTQEKGKRISIQIL